ncbi:DUF421 domain-containing protein [Roseobacteraceae bacterium NS-SX3]
MSETAEWFSSWSRRGGIALSSVFFFALAVAVIRLLGKRGAGQMTNFDWILTVAIGSLMASGILLKSVAVADAAMAIAAIALCQYALTAAVVRFPAIERLARPRPRLLTHKGAWLDSELLRERITREEVHAALRRAGIARAEDANWVVMEPDGSLSVVPRQEIGLAEAGLMENVQGKDSAPAEAGQNQAS